MVLMQLPRKRQYPWRKQPRTTKGRVAWKPLARHMKQFSVPRPWLNIRTGGYRGLELKFADKEYDANIAVAVAGSEADPTQNCLNGVAQGTTESQRIGRVQFVKSVYIKGHLFFRDATGTGITADDYVRLFLVLDKQTNGAQMNAEDFLDDPTNAALDVDAMQNLQYSDRFQLLKTPNDRDWETAGRSRRP